MFWWDLPVTDYFRVLRCCVCLFSHWVVSDSLRPHELQHTSLPWPSLSTRVCSNSCPLSLWYYLIISSSAAPFSLAFNLSQHQSLFEWVGSLHQVAKVLKLQRQSFQWISGLISFRMDWLDLAVQGTLESLLQHRRTKASVLQCSVLLWSNPHIHTWLLGKTIALTRWTFD